MYYYSLAGYDEKTIIQHEKIFTNEEFHKMCKEAPLVEMNNRKYYDTENIIEYLSRKYGFKQIKTTSGFFKDDEIE